MGFTKNTTSLPPLVVLPPVQRKMTKKTERKVNISGKPKHSLDANRTDGKNTDRRSAATVRRLQMYKTRPKRDRKGKVLSNEFQSKELPNTRIQPDRRWFGMYTLLSCRPAFYFITEKV